MVDLSFLRTCLCECRTEKCWDCLIHKENWFPVTSSLRRVTLILDLLGVDYQHTTVERGFDLGEEIEVMPAPAIKFGNVIIYEGGMGYVWIHKGTVSYGVDTDKIRSFVTEIYNLVRGDDHEEF